MDLSLDCISETQPLMQQFWEESYTCRQTTPVGYQALHPVPSVVFAQPTNKYLQLDDSLSSGNTGGDEIHIILADDLVAT